MAAEQETRRRLFGDESFTAHPHYLRAIEEKLRGGSFRECVKAFYESVLDANPSADVHATLKLAANRVTRVFQGGGQFSDSSGHVTNSQPLVYLEQVLLGRELAKKEATDVLKIGGVNMELLAQFKEKGLVNTDDLFVPGRRPSDIILPEVETMLREE